MNDANVNLVPKPRDVHVNVHTYRSKDFFVKETTNPVIGVENYKLTIAEDMIRIEGGGEAGLFYGKMTLEQLKFQYSHDLPCMEITDGPAYPYRSFHIDTARHYMKIEDLKKMIKAAASFKLNKFHWHFSDDQGWRIESIRFPKLHEIGARRKGNHFGQYHSDEEEFYFYSRDEVRELVGFCRNLGIEIVP